MTFKQPDQPQQSNNEDLKIIKKSNKIPIKPPSAENMEMFDTDITIYNTLNPSVIYRNSKHYTR